LPPLWPARFISHQLVPALVYLAVVQSDRQQFPGQDRPSVRLVNDPKRLEPQVHRLLADVAQALEPIHAVGVNRSSGSSHAELAAQLTPGRDVVAKVGDQVILQNTQGALCLVDLLEVQQEVAAPTFVPASVRFRYRILVNA